MIHQDRLTARIDGDFVVFLIGMRINRPPRVDRWWPVAAMQTASFFAERRSRADLAAFRKLLNRAGGEPPRESDER